VRIFIKKHNYQNVTDRGGFRILRNSGTFSHQFLLPPLTSPLTPFPHPLFREVAPLNPSMESWEHCYWLAGVSRQTDYNWLDKTYDWLV